MIDQSEISYIDEAPRLTYGVNILKDTVGNEPIFHIFTDNGYAMYSGVISQAAMGKVVTEEQKELYAKFTNVLDDWRLRKHFLKTYGMDHTNVLENIRPLAYVYNIVFDLTFRRWINQMLPYCGKNALIILPSNAVPTMIKECIVFNYDRQGHLAFYGEYICDEENENEKK